MKNLFRSARGLGFCLLAVLLGSASALAQETAPDALVKRVSAEVLAAVGQDKDLQAGHPARIRALVEAKILPHFDARRATQIALGVNWRRATPEQQEQLVREFSALLVRTYAGALASYRSQTLEFIPLRARPGDAEVTVRSRVRQGGTEPVLIEYELEKGATGWKVFDIRVGGISLVANYRSTFAEEVRNHGIDGLIGSLASRNRS